MKITRLYFDTERQRWIRPEADDDLLSSTCFVMPDEEDGWDGTYEFETRVCKGRALYPVHNGMRLQRYRDRLASY